MPGGGGCQGFDLIRALYYLYYVFKHACIFSFFAGSQKKFAVSPAWSKLARFA
jgi:hypothetical protein